MPGAYIPMIIRVGRQAPGMRSAYGETPPVPQ